MRIKPCEITAKDLRSLLCYDGHTGLLTRKKSITNSGKQGDAAGGPMSSGYISISVMGKRMLAHRVIWCHHYGAWPVGFIDHIDGNKQNNRIDNLRDVSFQSNMENRNKPYKNNKCGVLGVHYQNGLWRARIRVAGRLVSLGLYETPEEAGLAYMRAKLKYHDTCVGLGNEKTSSRRV